MWGKQYLLYGMSVVYLLSNGAKQNMFVFREACR